MVGIFPPASSGCLCLHGEEFGIVGCLAAKLQKRVTRCGAGMYETFDTESFGRCRRR